ncbi:threonylcarbamoyl-AMP synthase [Candidatus Uhrbacteria bacterium]|nr:threonylcarbamoyl-AMP synthase [Candidatus Uhrbacteria bacterium]
MSPTARTLREALRVLRAGGVALIPTETSYALAVDATNAAAVRRVFHLKGRAEQKTLPLIASSRVMAERYAVLGSMESALAKKYWPGPLTLVVPAKKNVGLAKGVVAKDGTIAIRVSRHAVARALSRRLKVPIVSTSANRAGEPPVFSPHDLSFSLDAVVDAGKLRQRKPSTIVRIVEGKIVILRQGKLGAKLLTGQELSSSFL